MTFWTDLLCNENVIPLFCGSPSETGRGSWAYVACDYNCLINASLFDGGVCALVFFSLWESTFCIVRLRNVCRLHVHVSYVTDVCVCVCVWLRECSWFCRYACPFNCITIVHQRDSNEDACVMSFVSGCVTLIVLSVCTTPGILTVSCMPLHGPVRQQVCVCVCAGISVRAHVCHVSVCLCLYEALLKLDRRCCTMHSFIFYVMNILLSSSYQLQYYLSGWMYCTCS